MVDFDTIRAKYPHLGFAVYAYTPADPVTLECMTADGRSFKFEGPTLADAIAAGFGEEEPAPTPETPVAETAPADASVFD